MPKRSDPLTHWVRFTSEQWGTGFGTLEERTVHVHSGDMFQAAEPTGETVAVEAVQLLVPCRPTKIVALWNNLRAAAEKQSLDIPAEPLYFTKPPSSLLADGGTVRRPRSYPGRILFEGELGVVIGSRCVDVAPSEVDDVVFGYTCVNDVTALDLITEDPSFAQWCRAKSFDTFAVLGPAIASGLEPDSLVVRTTAGGRLRQEYPVSDMIFSPRELVARLSRDMTLEPGDVIACGTSLGAMPMRPGVPVEVSIEGIGVLTATLGGAPD